MRQRFRCVLQAVTLRTLSEPQGSIASPICLEELESGFGMSLLECSPQSSAAVVFVTPEREVSSLPGYAVK
jgi:hypothetical protein